MAGRSGVFFRGDHVRDAAGNIRGSLFNRGGRDQDSPGGKGLFPVYGIKQNKIIAKKEPSEVVLNQRKTYARSRSEDPKSERVGGNPKTAARRKMNESRKESGYWDIKKPAVKRV
jgi:hypothetical protein